MPRLHGIAEAATAGRLDVDRLTALAPEEAMAELQRLPGIGPFYSALVVVRACGLTDVLSTQEPHSRRAVQASTASTTSRTTTELASIAEAWRPFRTWATVALRAVGSRLCERRLTYCARVKIAEPSLAVLLMVAARLTACGGDDSSDPRPSDDATVRGHLADALELQCADPRRNDRRGVRPADP